MIKKLFAVTLVWLFFSCKEEPVKQNFVFILVDDLGWTDLGYSGSTFYETPNIDAFSKKSINFTNAYASASICSPSRAAILTGKHPAKLNITDWLPGDDPKDRPLIGAIDLNQLPLSEPTLPEILKDNGYKTFFAGKWHLGDQGFLPTDHGFQTNIGGYKKGQPPGGYYSPYKNPYLKDGKKGEYLTDRLTQESINFLDTISNKPFLLFLSYYTVHTPIQANTAYIDKFETKLKNLDSLKVSHKKEGTATTKMQQTNPDYASMLFALDKNIGNLIEKLKKEGLYNNTTIIFTSDNGGLSTLEPRYSFKAPTSVRPLRAGKGWLYEGGIRVPLLVKPSNFSLENIISEVPVVGHDFFPTLLSQANIKINDSLKIDGIDISKLFVNDEILRNEIYWHYPHYHGSGWTPGAAIRQGHWKLIEFYETKTVELYNLANDVSETNNLANEFPQKAKALQARLHELQKNHNANTTTTNPMAN
ncbi:sulfatase [Gelatiniphilus marinus]|uniref:Sulfatase n=1 Tax=Gelatiniphilus marinus TaxID=1759464 RepID=A0ABW5JXX7_9FLAO